MQKIHLVVSAIVGANLISLVTHASSVQSLDCFQPLQTVKTAVPHDAPPLATVSSPIAVLPVVHPPAHHPRTQGVASASRVSTLSMSDAEIDAAIARERDRDRTPLPTAPRGVSAFGMTQAQIDQENEWDRQHLPQPQTAGRCEVSPADGQTYCGEG